MQRKLVSSSRPKIDADLRVIERYALWPFVGPDDVTRLCDAVSLAELSRWNGVGGLRDRARIHGIFTDKQDRALYCVLVLYHYQPLMVREAIRRVIRLLDGCQRRIKMRVSFFHPKKVKKAARVVGWADFTVK